MYQEVPEVFGIFIQFTKENRQYRPNGFKYGDILGDVSLLYHVIVVPLKKKTIQERVSFLKGHCQFKLHALTIPLSTISSKNIKNVMSLFVLCVLFGFLSA